MRLIYEDRVEQAIRHLPLTEAKKVNRVLRQLETTPIKNLRLTFHINKLSSPGHQAYVLRATPKLRILFKYEEDQTIIIEDIVSRDVLEKFWVSEFHD